MCDKLFVKMDVTAATGPAWDNWHWYWPLGELLSKQQHNFERIFPLLFWGKINCSNSVKCNMSHRQIILHFFEGHTNSVSLLKRHNRMIFRSSNTLFSHMKTPIPIELLPTLKMGFFWRSSGGWWYHASSLSVRLLFKPLFEFSFWGLTQNGFRGKSSVDYVSHLQLLFR